MNRPSQTTLRQQAASLAGAAVMTLAVLVGLSGIADHQVADVLQASAPSARDVQQVVVIGQRVARS